MAVILVPRTKWIEVCCLNTRDTTWDGLSFEKIALSIPQCCWHCEVHDPSTPIFFS